MNIENWRQTGILPILAASAFFSAASPALAQSGEQPADDTAEIVVMAPRSITPDLPQNEDKPRQKAVISISMAARFEDLDLSKPENVDRLMVRIQSVARDACGYLDRLYPLDVDPECKAKAVANAMPQAQKAIAAAAAHQGS
ncbi:MAG: UrcA family protein [Novosphingobium sp.]|nr:UrcA family protein [Novosphingobium sp.]